MTPNQPAVLPAGRRAHQAAGGWRPESGHPHRIHGYDRRHPWFTDEEENMVFEDVSDWWVWQG